MRKIILFVSLALLLSGCNYQGGYRYDSYRYSVPYYGWYGDYYDYGYYRYRHARPYYRGAYRAYPRYPGSQGVIPAERSAGYGRPAAVPARPVPPRAGFGNPRTPPGMPMRGPSGRSPIIKKRM